MMAGSAISADLGSVLNAVHGDFLDPCLTGDAVPVKNDPTNWTIYAFILFEHVN